jgi:hypothetical protein
MDPTLNPAGLPYTTDQLFGPLGPISVKAFQRKDAVYSSLRNTTTASNEVSTGGGVVSGGGGGNSVDLSGILLAISELEVQILNINQSLAQANISGTCVGENITITLNFPGIT